MFIYWGHWNKSSHSKAYLACIYMIFWRDCRQKLARILHLCVCLDLLHVGSLLRIYAVEQNVSACCHVTFKGSGPKLADWSKWNRITLRSCFCKSLTANWEVSTARSLIIFVNFVQIQKNRSKFVHWKQWNKASIWGAYLASTYMIIWRDCCKTVFGCFIYVFVSICSFSCHT